MMNARLMACCGRVTAVSLGEPHDTHHYRDSIMCSYGFYLLLILRMRSIHDLSNARKTALEESRKYYQFLQDSEEEEAWLVEKCRAMKSQDVGKDLAACNSLLMKHQVLYFIAVLMIADA